MTLTRLGQKRTNIGILDEGIVVPSDHASIQGTDQPQRDINGIRALGVGSNKKKIRILGCADLLEFSGQ